MSVIKKIKNYIFGVFFILLTLYGCSGSSSAPSTCLDCHKNIEQPSKSHTVCVSCHGGDSENRDKNSSHRTMLGPKNPSDPEYWGRSCGACHPYQHSRVSRNLMYTATGMIKNIQLTWEGEGGKLYSSRGGVEYDSKGKPINLHPVSELDNLSGELYRKFCSQCHVAQSTGDIFSVSHASGCAACHFPYNDTATYTGADENLRGKSPYSQSHKMEPLPDTTVCFRCHNRSGRIALSYQGLYDGNNAMVPTRNGKPGAKIISGPRSVTHISPDVHFAAGMECIDCHTSRDVMGDGYAYENMYLQTEVACQDCHGDGENVPRYKEISRENESPIRESKSYRLNMTHGEKMILTSKGRPYSNVFYRDGKILLQGKRSGKLHISKTITGTPAHLIKGHRRMECYSCHSRTVVQCYGCHTQYDKREKGTDFIKKAETVGAFSETEDYRSLYPFPLAINQRGKISTVTPGCQTFITTIEEDGTISKDEYVAKFKGKRQLRFAPFYSHNTGKKAVGCSECHANPAFLGFGQHVASNGAITGTLICDRSEDKPLDAYLKMSDGKVKAYSAITRENSRPFNTNEVRKIFSVNLCLPCHEKAEDPIYRKELNQRALEDSLHRPLLGGHRR